MKVESEGTPLRNSLFLTRIVFLRYLGVVYLTAFVVALWQNEPLISDSGLTPICGAVNRRLEGVHGLWEQLTVQPGLIPFVGCSFSLLYWTAVVGALLSLFVVVKGASNSIILAILWVLYHTLSGAGHLWYGFGKQALGSITLERPRIT